jgi:3-oxoacyl-[acyl-carrier protein] reductase
MDLGLKNKVAFVSGSSKGMGKAAATIMAEEGAKVVITGRGHESVSSTVEEIINRTNNLNVIGIPGDLTTKEGVQSAVRQTIDRWGRIDIAVSNVYGPPSQGKAFESVKEEDWFQSYQQQVMHVVYLTSEVIPYMKKNRWGRLINIGSSTSKEPPRGIPTVTGNTVRPAVIGLQKSLSYELAEYGITVNNVLPGATETERFKNERGKLKESGQKMVIDREGTSTSAMMAPWEEIPMRRFADPKEIGAVIAFLASQQASYVTGVTIQVDGGRMRSLF